LGKKQIVQLLRDEGFKVEAHDDHFSEDTPDTHWIPIVAKKKWVALTNDKCISRNSLEIDAHMTAGGRAFTPKGKMHPLEFGRLIVQSRERIFRYLKQAEKDGSGPFMSKLCFDQKSQDRAGHVEKWIDVEIWQIKILKRTKR
jgi:hypothetical protein